MPRELGMRPLRPFEAEPPSANVDVARLRLRSRHLSLWELEAKGVLDLDRDKHLVEKGIRFDEMWNEIL